MILALKDAARMSRRAVPSRTDISHRMAAIRNVWTEQERKRRAELSLLLQLKLLASCEAISVED
ncbi:MAG TPA: hypothetical protein VHY91_17745 [Pirellulales bacterium]|jgi:hypothetical protein|nr:hypothetical protein [Pirellulales bacterium]